jgi:hypothetical protein
VPQKIRFFGKIGFLTVHQRPKKSYFLNDDYKINQLQLSETLVYNDERRRVGTRAGVVTQLVKFIYFHFLSILISFIFAFGMTSALHHNFQEIQALPWVKEFATISIMLIFITPASERFKRHIIKGKRFWVWFDEE